MRIRYLCQKCYEAECKRLGTDEMEVYTSPSLGIPCDLCGAESRYSLPGYERPNPTADGTRS